jgi:hypothetical protein|tara:strand:- start:1159 stop:1611 length:453 start_codon:yes stop_codon:yes gene_type:complete
MSARKRFSKRLFEENDELARNAVEHLRHHFGVDCFKDSKNRYTIDREGWRDETHLMNIEVEVKHNWKKGLEAFPYDTIHLPKRKEKYFGLSKPTYFVIFSSDLQGAIVFSDRTAMEHGKLKEVPNKFVPKGELFYSIPIQRTAWLKCGDV